MPVKLGFNPISQSRVIKPPINNVGLKVLPKPNKDFNNKDFNNNGQDIIGGWHLDINIPYNKFRPISPILQAE